MRKSIFDALAPVCPRCLHAEGAQSPLKLAQIYEERAGVIWHGVLHCSNPACWTEFPIIDGVPIIVPDPKAYLKNNHAHIIARDDLAPDLMSLIGDAEGQSSAFDAARLHISLYADAHFCDWEQTADARPSAIAAIMARGGELMDLATDGAALDLGASVGRGVWELAARRRGPVLGGDLNFSMLRLAQKLIIEGTARYPRRRVGLAYDSVEIVAPTVDHLDAMDFWAMDAVSLPFGDAVFQTSTALNLVDCIAYPTNMLAELARTLRPGGDALLTTPFDWSHNATDASLWLGGHSQRAPGRGAAEPVFTATLAQVGLSPYAEDLDFPWRLRLHGRAEMQYSMHMAACRRNDDAPVSESAASPVK